MPSATRSPAPSPSASPPSSWPTARSRSGTRPLPARRPVPPRRPTTSRTLPADRRAGQGGGPRRRGGDDGRLSPASRPLLARSRSRCSATASAATATSRRSSPPPWRRGGSSSPRPSTSPVTSPAVLEGRLSRRSGRRRRPQQTLLVLAAQNVRADSPLAGRIDMTKVAAVGHSAGGGAAFQLAGDPSTNVATVVGLAPALAGDQPVDTLGKPSLTISGTADAVIPGRPVARGVARMCRSEAVGDAGGASPTSASWTTAAQGNLLAIGAAGHGVRARPARAAVRRRLRRHPHPGPARRGPRSATPPSPSCAAASASIPSPSASTLRSPRPMRR